MAKNDYQKYGLSSVDDGTPDFSKYGLSNIDDSAQPENKANQSPGQIAQNWAPDPSKMAPPTTPPSFGQRVWQNIKSDFTQPDNTVKFGEGVINSPFVMGNNLYRTLGLTPKFTNPITESDPNSLATMLGHQAAPLALTTPISSAIEGAPLLSNSPLGRFALRGISGGVTSPAFGVNPVAGASINAFLPAALSAISANPIKNAVLAMARRGINTPQEAAQSFAQNFASSPQTPIGSIANAHGLNTLNALLKYVPFSGAGKAGDILGKDVAQAQGTNLANQMAEKKGMVSTLQNAPSNLPVQPDNVSQEYNTAVNAMNTAPDKTDSAKGLSDAIQTQAKSNQAQSKINYSKVNNDLRLDEGTQGADMPNYTAVAQDLNQNADRLRSTYGSSNDVDRTVLDELNKAQYFLEQGNKDVGLTVGAARTRNSDLGEAAQTAKQNGDWVTSSLLQRIRNAFNTDFHNNLSLVDPEMASNLQVANEYHANNVAPFYQKGVIRNAYTGKTAENATLANHLLSHNGDDVWQLLNPDAQSLASHLALTKGAGNTAGVYTGDANEISKNWSNLSPYVKNKIDDALPGTADHFDALPSKINAQNLANLNQTDMYNQSEKMRQSQINAYQNKLLKLQDQHQKNQLAAIAPSSTSKQLAKNTIFTLGGLAGHHFLGAGFDVGAPLLLALARRFSTASRNPLVRNAFLQSQKLDPTAIGNALRNRAAQKAITNALLASQSPQLNQNQ